jgi:hypothetical protein
MTLFLPRSTLNGFHVNVSAIIQKFRVQHPDIELQHIASSKNLRFHGRFHIAYMLEEDYVSVWDDDMLPRTEWLGRIRVYIFLKI